MGGAASSRCMDPLVGVGLIVVDLVLLLHHGWKHHFEEEPSNARQESCVWVCYFQPKDIAHYESWGVISLTNAFWCVADSNIDDRRAALAVFFFLAGVMLLFISSATHSSMFGCVVHNVCNHETWILVCFTGRPVCYGCDL